MGALIAAVSSVCWVPPIVDRLTQGCSVTATGFGSRDCLVKPYEEYWAVSVPLQYKDIRGE